MKTNRLVQGAMLAALFGVLSLLNTYTGTFFDSLIGFFMVIPFAWYGYSYSLKDSFAVSVASMLVVFMTGIPSFILIAFITCLMGMYIGECLRRKTSQSVLLLGTVAISFLDFILVYEVFAGILGVDLIQEMTETYEMISSVEMISQAVPLKSFLDMIPFMIFMMSLAQGYVVVLLCQAFFVRFKIPFPNDFHILRFALSPKIGYPLLALLLLCFALMRFAHIDHIVIRYVYIAVMMVFVIDGMAAAAAWLIVHHHPRLAGLIFFGFFIPPVLMALVIIGVVDTITQWRTGYNFNRS